MNIPPIEIKEPKRQDLSAFFGLNRQPSAKVGESVDEENVTSALFPYITCAKDTWRLSNAFGKCRALTSKYKPAWVVENAGGSACRLYWAGTLTPPVLSPGEKQIVTIGTKIVVFPDKVYYDTVSGEYGSLDSHYESTDEVAVTFIPARLDGIAYDAGASPAAPEDPADGVYWCDTSQSPAALMRYSAASGTWIPVESTFIKITSVGIDSFFNIGDGVTVSGATASELNSSFIVEERGEDYIVVAGLIPSPVTQYTPITVERRSPTLDYAVEYGNRIWGCRAGLSADGEVVNEIYCSKLGDPFNWRAYGTGPSASYAAGVGSDGPFTGASVHLGYVMFFKERCVHKVFGTKPSNFQIITQNLRGVKEGAKSSPVAIDDCLYYSGPDGITAYDGTYPFVVSEALGDEPLDSVVLTSSGRYLYVAAERAGARELYVYDTKRALWHRRTPMAIDCMAGTRFGVLAAAEGSLYVIDSTDAGAGAANLTGLHDRRQCSSDWYFETGELTDSSSDHYVTRFEISCAVPAHGKLKIYLIGDSGEKLRYFTMNPTVRRTFRVPLIAERNRRARIRIEGSGHAVVYGIARYVEYTGG